MKTLKCKRPAIVSTEVNICFLDLLKTNLTIYILDEDIFHIMASDPRKNFRNLYLSNQVEIYQLKDIEDIRHSDQASILERKVNSLGLTSKILNGQPPNRQHLEETYMLLACAHFLRVNDVLSEAFNTYLARTMDSGIVAKIYRKYYLSDGN